MNKDAVPRLNDLNGFFDAFPLHSLECSKNSKIVRSAQITLGAIGNAAMICASVAHARMAVA
jgi:hypothetical protein